MSFARMSPTPSTASSSASVAARISSSPPNSPHDPLDHQLRQARDAAEDAVAARRDGMVERVELAVVAEQLGQPAEVEQVLVRQPRQRVEHQREALLGRLGDVVVHERRLVGGDADHRLLELHLDQAALGAELDDVALDLDRHARHELGALEHGEHVVQRHAALELERGEAGRDLVEAAAVLVERGERLVGLGEHHRDVLEDVLGAVEVERHDAAALRDRDHERVGLLRDALGGAVAGAGLEREDRRVRHQLDVGPADLRAVRGEDDRAVHLRQLEEQRRGVVDLELDAAGVEERQLLGVADADQRAGARLDDAVDALANRGAGRDHLERPVRAGVPAEPRALRRRPRRTASDRLYAISCANCKAFSASSGRLLIVAAPGGVSAGAGIERTLGLAREAPPA